MIKFKQFFTEKLIVGLEEIITLEGIAPAGEWRTGE